MFVNRNLLTRVLAVRMQKEGGNLRLRVEDEGACCRHCSMCGLIWLVCVVSGGFLANGVELRSMDRAKALSLQVSS